MLLLTSFKWQSLLLLFRFVFLTFSYFQFVWIIVLIWQSSLLAFALFLFLTFVKFSFVWVVLMKIIITICSVCVSVSDFWQCFFRPSYRNWLGDKLSNFCWARFWLCLSFPFSLTANEQIQQSCKVKVYKLQLDNINVTLCSQKL